MKVLTVANQKGGVGKTSILFHLAAYLTRAGKKCLVIDTDPQGNASFCLRLQQGVVETQITADRLITDTKAKPLLKDGQTDGTGPFLCASTRALLDVEKQSLQKTAETFRNNIDRLAEHDAPVFDYALIDTGPNLSDKMGAALVASDYVISPIVLDVFGISGLAMMLDTIETYKKANKKLKFLGLVPNMVQKEYQRGMLEELKKQHPAITIPCPIGNRDSIREAITTGIPVWKIQKTAARKAAKEMLALGDFVFKAMETDNGKKKRG